MERKYRSGTRVLGAGLFHIYMLTRLTKFGFMLSTHHIKEENLMGECLAETLPHQPLILLMKDRSTADRRDISKFLSYIRVYDWFHVINDRRFECKCA